MSKLLFWKAPGFYKTARSLHLYLGMFIAPLLLIFAVSILVINHSHPVKDQPAPVTEKRSIQTIPAQLDSLESVRQIMDQAELAGWVTFFRLMEDGQQFRFIVMRPTVRRNVSLDLRTRELQIQSRPHDWRSIVYWLHTMPGPHTQHKNWFFLSVWWVLADVVVYAALFLTMSGLYLWYFLRSERKVGLGVLTLGIVWILVAAAALLA